MGITERSNGWQVDNADKRPRLVVSTSGIRKQNLDHEHRGVGKDTYSTYRVVPTPR
jgi:hypothetical protein